MKTIKGRDVKIIPDNMYNIIASDNFAVEKMALTKSDGIVTGTIVIRCTSTWGPGNNTDVLQILWKPRSSLYFFFPALVTPSLWTASVDYTGCAYMNDSGFLKLNWNVAIETGKSIKIPVSYSV